MDSVKVELFGHEYSIKGDVDMATTREVAEYVRQKLTGIHEHNTSRDKLKSAILCAMNITGELFDIKKQYSHKLQGQEGVESRANSLCEKIDAALKK